MKFKVLKVPKFVNVLNFCMVNITKWFVMDYEIQLFVMDEPTYLFVMELQF